MSTPVRSVRSFGLLAAAGLVACGAPRDEGAPISAAPSALRGHQGTTLGVFSPAFFFGPTLEVVGGSIRARAAAADPFREGAALAGLTVDATTTTNQPARIEFRAARPHVLPDGSSSPDQYEYDLVVTIGGLAQEPCTLDDGSAAPALAIPGFFNADGRYAPNTTGFQPVLTLACINGGKVATCLDWGYRPWTGIPPKVFESCTDLARADYCGDGSTNTVPGTIIELYDRGVRTPPINTRSAADLALEAVWTYPSSNPDPGQPSLPGVLCLAKRRWDTLPPRGSCGDLLVDPRLSGPRVAGCAPVSGPGVGSYCEDRSLDDWLQVGRQTYGDPGLGVLVNDSSYNDAGLYRWDELGAGRAYSTSRYDLWKDRIDGTSGPRLGAGYRYHCFEGKVYRVLPSGVPGDLLALVTYRNAAGETVTTTQGAPAGFAPTAQDREGYIFSPSLGSPPADYAPLYRWQAAGHWVTSTSVSGRPVGAILEGWLPRSRDAAGRPFCDVSRLGAADFPSPPRITCPAPVTVECQGNGCAQVTPGVACASGTVTGPGAACFPLGTTVTSYSAQDPIGQTSACTSSVTVVDTRPPAVQGAPAAAPLWPPDHGYRTVTLADCGVRVTDQCQGALGGAAAQAEITCVSSDEPETSPGSGSTRQDIVIVDPRTVRLRAEREGAGDGRVYRIEFRVRDAAGNAAAGTCRVTVPKDQSPRGAAVDSGRSYAVCR